MATAITYSQFGSPEVLELTEVDVPEPGPGQVRVRVRAASVNPIDIKIRRGDLAASIPTEFPINPGMEVAGTVEAVGDGVVDTAVGDNVLGIVQSGAYAEYAVLAFPISKPEALSWEAAGALSVVGEAAYRALDHLDLKAGETLLIHGAAGSVGSIATQLAASRGVKVIGSVAEADQDYARSLGATPVIYGDGLIDRVRAVAPSGIDAVLDTAGHGVLPDSIELAGGPERVITIADMSAAEYGVRFTGGDPTDRIPEAVAELVELASSGKLELKIWRSYPLAEAATAHAEIEAGNNHGKIVLVP